MKACDQGLFACGVYLDLKKAFDTVNHNILLSKLHHHGIRGKVNDWFKSFLVKRNQYTRTKMQILFLKKLCMVSPRAQF